MYIVWCMCAHTCVEDCGRQSVGRVNIYCSKHNVFKSERGPIANVRTTDINQDCPGQSDTWQLIHRAFISPRQSTDKMFDDHWFGCVKTFEICVQRPAAGQLQAWRSEQPGPAHSLRRLHSLGTARSPRLVSLLSGTQFCPGNSYFSLGLTFSGAYLDVTVFEETSRRFLL